jgi:predicted TPR repeat methyltransferase
MQQPEAVQSFERAKKAFIEGLRCQQAGALDQAETHYRESLRLLPGRASTLINLAATQLQLRRPADAIGTAEAALAAEPSSTDALLHRASALAELGRLHEALTDFERLLSLDADHAVAWSSKGGVLRELRRFDESARAYRRALQLGAEVELNAYYLAAVEQGVAPPSPPAIYVQGLFDGYAEDFDRHLVDQLHYDGHLRLINGLAALDAGPYQSALDLGCGTGLCGPKLRPMVARLTGVDLSARMLDKARALDLYDKLEHADAVGFMRGTDERYDLLLASDVFVYIGALGPLFEAANRVMRRGVLCFSVEVLEDGDSPFRLDPSLRYAHSRPYLLGLAAQHSFELISMQSAPVREDQGKSVAGLYVYLRVNRPSRQ